MIAMELKNEVITATWFPRKVCRQIKSENYWVEQPKNPQARHISISSLELYVFAPSVVMLAMQYHLKFTKKNGLLRFERANGPRSKLNSKFKKKIVKKLHEQWRIVAEEFDENKHVWRAKNQIIINKGYAKSLGCLDGPSKCFYHPSLGWLR
jgi:hypothetical protein